MPAVNTTKIELTTSYRDGFNAGSQARINGQPHVNPYRQDSNDAAYKGWRNGYIHVSTCWGADNPRARELQRVRRSI